VPQPSVAFDTTVTGSEGKTGIVMPEELMLALGAGRCPAVHVDLDGYRYPSTVVVMGGAYLLWVDAGVRKAVALFREGKKR
jgi:hypothetical protein